MEINDRYIVFKPNIDSKPEEYVESSLTSMWKIDCNAQSLPCLASTFVDGNPEAEKKLFGTNAEAFVTHFLKELEPSKEYKLEHCMILRFHGSLLSSRKTEAARENGDNSTCSLICPFKLEYTINMQLGFLTAFNRAMYLINPIQDLPEAAETQLFSVDVYRGGDKLEASFVSFTEESAEIKKGAPLMTIKYENIVQCRVVYAIRKDELPDPIYKNLIDEAFYVASDVQSDCCIFFKMIDQIDIEGKLTEPLLNNM